MPKVFISPDFPNPDRGDGGIRRVVSAMRQYLPQYGWQVVDSREEADLLNCHAMERLSDSSKPMVYSSHGLMWADYEWPTDLLKCNQFMVDTMAMSQAITVPSNWVGMAIARGMLRKPKTIYHGVDISEWQVTGDHKGYVLWNKARHDVVSNVNDMHQLAAIMPDVPFVSTIGNKTDNVIVMGVVPYENMKRAIAHAGVYLATARETFGIGTLEALASGVPVAGWDFGGQREIIQQGITGYLAPYGDYEALSNCVRLCLKERETLGKNARQDVIERWQWSDKIEQYAKLFDEVYEEWHKPRPKVSIIVTTHNLREYVVDCLDSVREQNTSDYECLIVDDASTDGTRKVIEDYLAKHPEFTQARYLPTPHNLKLSQARNYGFKHSNGRYITSLDGDDKLLPNSLSLLSNALDNDKAIHIAYGHIEMISEKELTPDGYQQLEKRTRRGDWPFPAFDWYAQMAHLNQLPYCSMMRREVYENVGGYRKRDWRAEDASFWSRATSFGFRAAKVTEDTILHYRIRHDSKGMTEKNKGFSDGDWTAWIPSRIGATNGKAGIEAMQNGKRPRNSLVPIGAQGKPLKHCWPVWSHHDPVISVIVPVGPNHREIVIDAIDSVQAQTFPFWEIVLVNDSGSPLDNLPAHVRVIDTNKKGVAIARNEGIKASKAPLLFFLDADDILSFTALEDMVREFIKHEASRYIYPDYFLVTVDGKAEATPSRDYNPFNGTMLNPSGISHPISCLMPREWCIKAGGFDPNAAGFEDWDFFVRMAIHGFCGQRLKKPLMYYRVYTGTERERAYQKEKEIAQGLTRKYEYYVDGVGKMTPCCGGFPVEKLRELAAITGRSMGLIGPDNQEKDYLAMSDIDFNQEYTRMEWTGNNSGAITLDRVAGKLLTRAYRPTKLPIGDHWINAPKADVPLLLQHGGYKVVKRQDEGIDFQPEQPVVSVTITPELDFVPQLNVGENTATAVESWLQAKPEEAKQVVVIDTSNGIDEVEASQAGKVLADYVPNETSGTESMSNTAILKKSITEIEVLLPSMKEGELASLRASEVKGKKRISLLAMIDAILDSRLETV